MIHNYFVYCTRNVDRISHDTDNNETHVFVPMTDPAERRIRRRLRVICLLSFVLMMYGGVRSPDSEIIFRAGESLVLRQSFAVSDLEGWRGFGVARGTDGNSYPIFEPLQSVLLAPFIAAAELINRTGWYQPFIQYLPVSLNAGTDAGTAITLNRPLDPELHALRFLVSFFNVIVSTLLVMSFYRILRKLKLSALPAFWISLLYGLGTLVLPYSGTMFTEPLSTLFSLLSLELILGTLGDGHLSSGAGWKVFLSGFLLGCAVATHITAALLIPFYGLYLYLGLRRQPGAVERQEKFILTELLLLGISVMAMLLLWYNYARFSNPGETGRTVDYATMMRFGYGYFVAPWQGLLGLLASSGKGILWYCPAAVVGLLFWNRLRKRDALLAWTVLGIVLLRWIFIASRFDWPGGFCAGPRYLVPVIPFALIPAAFWLEDQLTARNTMKLFLFLLGSYVAAVEQFYLALGEVFSHYYLIVIFAGKNIGKLFADWNIYFSPAYSPLFHILDGRRGPFLLKLINIPNSALFQGGLLVMTVLACWAAVVLWRHLRGSTRDLRTQLETLP